MKNGYLDKKDVVGSHYFQDANGNVFVATSKQWTSEDTNIIFEKDREFIEKYLEEERR